MKKEVLICGTAAIALTTACDHKTESIQFPADVLYQKEKASPDYMKAYTLLLESYNLSHREIINFIHLAGNRYYSDINSINYLESVNKALNQTSESEKSPKTLFGDPDIQSNENLSDQIQKEIKEAIKKSFPDSEETQLRNFNIYQNSLGRYYVDYMGSPIRIDDDLNELLTHHFEPLYQTPNELRLQDHDGKVQGFIDSVSHTVRMITQ